MSVPMNNTPAAAPANAYEQVMLTSQEPDLERQRTDQERTDAYIAACKTDTV